MKTVAQLVSWLALAGTILPPILFLAGSIELAQVKLWMLLAAVAWFVATPCWMGRKAAG